MGLPKDIVDELRRIVRERIDTDVPLSRLSSFRIGGPADVVVEPSDSQDLARLIRYLQDRNVPRILLGAGTNVLFHDAGFRGVVIRMGGIKGIEIHSNGFGHALITVRAGTPLPLVISRTCASGWTGLEALWGIPGSFGGAVMTNAGAGGICLGDFLEKVRLLNPSGEDIVLKKSDIRYGYRSTDFPGGTAVVEGTLRLQKRDTKRIETDLQLARAKRRASQPFDRFCAGCVFKNPSQDKPAGAIIDRLGFKGVKVGGAEVSRIHANFIVNNGDASSSDVLELIEKIRESVRKHEKIELDLEIRIVGEEAYDV